MKKLGYTLTLGAAMVFVALTGAKAQVIISANFQGSDTNTLGTTDSTGAISATNWNNISSTDTGPYAAYTGDPIVLNDSTGTPTDVELTAFGNGTNGPEGGLTADSTPQQVLFGGGLNNHFGPATFTVTGLDQFTSYDLTLYYATGAGFPQNRTAVFSTTGSALTYNVKGEAGFDSGFTQSNSTTAGVFENGNYVTYTGLTAANESVTFDVGGDQPEDFALVGFQIAGSNSPLAAPEPSTWALMLGGLVLLVGVQRLRRNAVQS